MLHPHTEIRLIGEAVGLGVFATRPIPRGTITWTLCKFDRIYSRAEVEAMEPAYRRIAEVFSYIDPEGRSVLCWDGARHMNHACDSNTFPIIPVVDIAVRDIAAGEQITCDYGTCNLLEELSCLCGAHDCRSTIRRRDALEFGATWDAKVKAVLPDVLQVAQPLMGFVQSRAALEKILRGDAAIFAHASYHLAR
jgi:hypothetical protein